jgi:hypothetical protein
LNDTTTTEPRQQQQKVVRQDFSRQHQQLKRKHQKVDVSKMGGVGEWLYSTLVGTANSQGNVEGTLHTPKYSWERMKQVLTFGF